MREHKLKTWPSQFAAVKSGVKTFEFRRNDRDFAVGDVLVLKEWDPSANYIGAFTGAEARVDVTYIVFGGQLGVPDGYCVMSIGRPQ